MSRVEKHQNKKVSNSSKSFTCNEKKDKYDKESKKKKKGKFKKVITWILIGIFTLLLIGIIYAGITIFRAPSIDTKDISSLLSQSTVIYDDSGKELETVYSGTSREYINIKKIPDNLQNAFISLEDKTFRTHSGFNFIRILGAIKEGIANGGHISGTSTITQQLARNIYLKESQYDYSFKRKIVEAYYTMLLEKNLSKDKILESYLNAVPFGFHTSGVEAASMTYFSKPAKDLSLVQCAALAALPQAPSRFQLVEFIKGGNPESYKDRLLKTTINGVYIFNDASKSRRDTCLKLMKEQGYIDEKQYKEAVNTSLKDMLNPNYNIDDSQNTYFVDFLIDKVVKDLQKEKELSTKEAWDAVYNGGLRIYSTLDQNAQKAVYEGINNPNNYPGLDVETNGRGDIINSKGVVLLYAYDNIFDKDGNYIIRKDDFKKEKNGDLIFLPKAKVNVYDTKVNGKVDYSLELKSVYKRKNGQIYSINGGYINVPSDYKEKTKEGKLKIKGSFFENKKYKDYFALDKEGNLLITPKAYTLRPSVLQPQGAMTIVDNKTGDIKAMEGGRGISGRQLLNRAVTPRQPGSSIKPLAVYGAAIEQSEEEVSKGQKHIFKDTGIDSQGKKYYGDYLTPASIIIDEPMHVEGREWPHNFSKTYSGAMTMRHAMQYSINTAAVKVLSQVGVGYSEDLLKKFGLKNIKDSDSNYAALALGGMARGATTLEMASAFSTFPNEGTRMIPSPYTKVIGRSGENILVKKDNKVKVLNKGVAYIMVSMLQSVPKAAYASGANIPGVVVGGKTGTTEDQRDIWFNGITPNYSASLWVGSDENLPLTSSSTMAATMWGNIMSRVSKANQGSYFEMPSNVEKVGGEYFIKGTDGGRTKVNVEKDIYKVCAESGMLATPQCKDVITKTVGKDKSKVPTTYCPIHNDDKEKYPVADKKDQDEKDTKNKDDVKSDEIKNDEDKGQSTDKDSNDQETVDSGDDSDNNSDIE